MSIQEVSLANNQKKRLLKVIKDPAVLFSESNGDLVVNASAYQALKKELSLAKVAKPHLSAMPIEDIVGDDTLDFSHEYFVFS